jgi:regulator of sigma E protease
VTRAALDGQDLQLMLSDRSGHGSRTARLALHELPSREVDAAAMRQIGIGARTASRCWAICRPTARRPAPAGQGRPRAGASMASRSATRRRCASASAPPWSRAGAAPAVAHRARGSVRQIEVQPRLVDDQGPAVGRIDAYVGAAPAMVTVRRGPVDGLVRGAERTWEISVLTVRMIGRMLIGEASVKNLSGPLTIADAAGQSAERGLAYYLGFLALVSVSLGVLNLLPLPMLDGGHLMYYLFEGVTGKPVSEIWLARLQRGGIAVLLVMMSVALFNDVARLLGLH